MQGQSGDGAIDLALQDKILIPKGFTEYICHVGNANDLNSIIRNELILGGKEASKEGDKRSSSLQWTRWKTYMAWVKLHAVRRNQGSLHTRMLGNAYEIMRSVAIWSSLKRKTCNFTKHDHMQSFPTTRHLQLALRKWHARRRRMSFTKRYAQLREYRGLVFLKSNSQHGQQDPQSRDARWLSWDPSSASKTYGETWNNAVDYISPGIPLSTVGQ